MKQRISHLFHLLAWLVQVECHYSDVAACKLAHGRLRVLAAEAEQNYTLHILTNIRRGLAAGAQHILVVTPEEKLRSRVRRMLRRHLSVQELRQVGLTTSNHIERCIRVLEQKQPNQ